MSQAIANYSCSHRANSLTVTRQMVLQVGHLNCQYAPIMRLVDIRMLLWMYDHLRKNIDLEVSLFYKSWCGHNWGLDERTHLWFRHLKWWHVLVRWCDFVMRFSGEIRWCDFLMRCGSEFILQKLLFCSVVHDHNFPSKTSLWSIVHSNFELGYTRFVWINMKIL